MRKLSSLGSRPKNVGFGSSDSSSIGLLGLNSVSVSVSDAGGSPSCSISGSSPVTLLHVAYMGPASCGFRDGKSIGLFSLNSFPSSSGWFMDRHVMDFVNVFGCNTGTDGCTTWRRNGVPDVWRNPLDSCSDSERMVKMVHKEIGEVAFMVIFEVMDEREGTLLRSMLFCLLLVMLCWRFLCCCL